MRLSGAGQAAQQQRSSSAACSSSGRSSSVSGSTAPVAARGRASARRCAATTTAAAAAPRGSLAAPSRQAAAPPPSWVACDAPAPAALATASLEEDAGPSSLAPDATEVIAYAMQMAYTGETYEVHTWMLLLGILKNERCAAARALQSAGLTDLYGAWHEVLWALNVSDGLEPRAFNYKMAWAPGTRRVVDGAVRFAGWAGREAVQSQDILLAIAAAGSLERLFPDLGLTFQAVRRAVQKETGDKYKLPDEDPADAAAASQDLFL